MGRGRAQESGRARPCGPAAIEERSAAEHLDQFSPLTVAEAADRLSVGDPAVGEHTIGPGRTDPGYDQEQLTYLRRLRAGWRVGDHLGKLDPAGGDLSLQLRTCDANLVRLRERA